MNLIHDADTAGTEEDEAYSYSGKRRRIRKRLIPPRWNGNQEAHVEPATLYQSLGGEEGGEFRIMIGRGSYNNGERPSSRCMQYDGHWQGRRCVGVRSRGEGGGITCGDVDGAVGGAAGAAIGGAFGDAPGVYVGGPLEGTRVRMRRKRYATEKIGPCLLRKHESYTTAHAVCAVATIILVVELILGASFVQGLTIAIFCGAGSAVGGAVVNTVRMRRKT